MLRTMLRTKNCTCIFRSFVHAESLLKSGQVCLSAETVELKSLKCQL